jgi:hypothetical protein
VSVFEQGVSVFGRRVRNPECARPYCSICSLTAPIYIYWDAVTHNCRRRNQNVVEHIAFGARRVARESQECGGRVDVTVTASSIVDTQFCIDSLKFLSQLSSIDGPGSVEGLLATEVDPDA